MFKAIPLFSGSSGNATYVKYGDDEILIDAGASYKNLRLALEKLGTDISNIKAIFITHEHSDHIKGLSVTLKHLDVPVYINQASFEQIMASGTDIFYGRAEIKNAGDAVSVGQISAKIFKTPHDSAGSVGYRFTFSDGQAFGYATDIGAVTPKIRAGLYGCKSVVIESNHDVDMLKSGPYPYMLKKRILSDHGHLSNDDCSCFLPELVEHGTEKLILAHLSHENNTPEAAYFAAAAALTEARFTPDDVKLTVAMRSIL